MKVSGSYYEDGYAHLEGLIPREVANAFLRQLKADIERSGTPWNKLEQPSNLLKRDAVELYGFHYPPMLTFLWALTPVMIQVTGKELLPTYSYFRVYREGDICRVHSDRYSCEHSLSLTLDYSDGVPWNLEIGTERVEPGPQVDESFGEAPYRSVSMQPGDAVLYQGVHHRHARTTPNPNGWSAHMFLHWVDKDGPYRSSAFDGQEAAAKPVNFSF
ncbi:MAG TPA: hypothetical protein VGD10_02690 [Allosphingosinicella sp.]|uniref:hypothetical protein n=1 Tax=Allosphingosinicella sp. TaxID=2823234 RepID=UPI002ED96FC0